MARIKDILVDLIDVKSTLIKVFNGMIAIWHRPLPELVLMKISNIYHVES